MHTRSHCKWSRLDQHLVMMIMMIIMVVLVIIMMMTMIMMTMIIIIMVVLVNQNLSRFDIASGNNAPAVLLLGINHLQRICFRLHNIKSSTLKALHFDL